MAASVHDDAARSFAIGFYGGLGERASVAAAWKQGRAAMGLVGQRGSGQPQLRVRAGVDAHQLVLAAESRAGMNATSAASSSVRAQVDVAILTIRDDEFRAVLDAFPAKAGRHVAADREYNVRYADIHGGERYTVAIVRQAEQGTGEAQSVAADLIRDLDPKLLLVVGIAGGLPSDEITLGDVILSTRIHDFTVEARNFEAAASYSGTGGPIDRALQSVLANLAARDDELGDWTRDLPGRPPVSWTRKGQLYGPPEWQRDVRARLEHHHGSEASPRDPRYVTGPIASSDRLIKDPTVLIPWLTTARHLLAIEMESAGAYRAARERCPMLAIRGISDIVGLKRSDAWTRFACASAAAFTHAFLRTRPVPPSSSPLAADP
jgi:nucleoside phosphorylase